MHYQGKTGICVKKAIELQFKNLCNQRSKNSLFRKLDHLLDVRGGLFAGTAEDVIVILLLCI